MTASHVLPEPKSLLLINRTFLTEFVLRFKDSLDATHQPLISPNTAAGDFCALWVSLLESPETIPAPMRQALAAIHDLAAPANRAKLAFVLSNAPLSLDLSLQSPPLEQAMYLWLRKRFPPPADVKTSPAADAPGSNAPDAPAAKIAGSAAPPSDAPDSLTLPLHVLFFELSRSLLRDFIAFFQTDLLAKYPDLPQPCPGSHAFLDAVVPLLAQPAHLPPRMHSALLAVQALAAPENRQLLHGLLAQSGIPTDNDIPPEHLALQFWLRCPFSADRLEFLRAQVPIHHPAVPNGNGIPQSAPLPASKPGENGRVPLSTIPGDLAALARFPRFKISRLPPAVRESVNQMLRQRIPYAQIIARLGEHGRTLNKSNLSRWKKTGYLLWLAEQQRREEAQAQIQLLFDLVRENENGKIHEATQQIAALRISQILAGFDPATLIQSLQQQPQAFVRLVQTLPSLSRGGMDCERLLLDLAKRKTPSPNEDDTKPRGLSKPTLKYIEQKLNLM